jgi:hypothetical protein
VPSSAGKVPSWTTAEEIAEANDPDNLLPGTPVPTPTSSADSTPPAIIELRPEANGSDVGNKTEIAVTFDEEVRNGSIVVKEIDPFDPEEGFLQRWEGVAELDGDWRVGALETAWWKRYSATTATAATSSTKSTDVVPGIPTARHRSNVAIKEEYGRIPHYRGRVPLPLVEPPRPPTR